MATNAGNNPRVNWGSILDELQVGFHTGFGRNTFRFLHGMSAPYLNLLFSPGPWSRRIGVVPGYLRGTWGYMRRYPWLTIGAFTGTAATLGAIAMGGSMALGGAYDLVTARRRSRLEGFTSLAMGAAIAGLPFYAPYLWNMGRRFIRR